MAQNKIPKTPDLKTADVQELQKTLSDLKIILSNLTTVVTRLDNLVTNSSTISDDEDGFQSAEEEIKTPVSVLKRVQSFQKQGREKNVQPKPNLTLLKITQKPKLERKESVNKVKNPEAVNYPKLERKESVSKVKNPEAVNETVIKSVQANSTSNIVTVRNIKKKFELNGRYQDSSDEESTNSGKERTEDKEIKVDIQSLKQKFEIENNDMVVSVTERLKAEEKRRKSEDNKSELTEEEAAKVKKILKYFQPRSK